jgi:predicted AlkP superfamily pyrophosphatase or phosphodiesterase
VRIIHFSSTLNLLVAATTLMVGGCGSDTGGPGPSTGGSSGSHDGASVGTGGSSVQVDAATVGTGGSVGTGGAVGTGGVVGTGGGSPDVALADAPARDVALNSIDGSKAVDVGGAVDAKGIDGGSKDSPQAASSRVIIFVWDGLRPDSITTQDTPNLAKLRDQQGVNFTDNHAVFPTFTMMNGAAFATGAYPGTHGFYGNTEYQPGPTGNDSTGKAVNFTQPVFTEDWSILHSLDNFYVGQNNSALFLVDTLFQAAHRAGLKTAAVGKSGPAFLQDYREDGTGGVILDENMAFPRTFAASLLSAGFVLPANTTRVPYDGGAISLDASNGNPTGTTNANIVLLADGVTSDPRAALGSPHDAKNEYMMGIYLNYILPQVQPDLSLIWFRNPDSTEHTFGPGSPNYLDALDNQDKLLGQLQAKLTQLGMDTATDIIVVSDHGHSLVAGDPSFFPLRGIATSPDGGAGTVGAADPQGYSASGDVRTADLLTRAGLAHVYDGVGCTSDPVLSGIKANGDPLYPVQTDDATGSLCGKGANFKYNTGAFLVPATVPSDAVIIAANGGSDYLYIPSHQAAIVTSVVTALQARKQYGAIFVRSTYGAIPGTMSLKDIKVEGVTRDSPPTPDIIVSFDWNDTAVTASNAAVPGTEYESAQNNRGMHGSFGPTDVHNTLVAGGPDFKTAFLDTYPSGNVDVAPTAAYLLGLSLPQANGRVLKEALRGQTVSYTVTPSSTKVGPVTLPMVCNPDDVACASSATETTYSMTLTTKTLVIDNNTSVTYFDKAKATRQ